MTDVIGSHEDEDRRQFLKSCGRFAIVTPPTVTALLSTSLTSTAMTNSGGGMGGKGGSKGNNGYGNGGGDGSPNGKQDWNR